ncbi:MAG: hypothetical protein CVU44_21505 [Chloroflexi bacterium HGW-Chloroflexi-6]|nr:MAG: hypothetical protein CVU44_21505 [Chloroflexi bacterium HGW-Chloroflexi-6]
MPIVLIALAALALFLWLGLQIQPAPFSIPDLPAAEAKTVLLPEELPKPVERFYRTVYGEQIPVIETVVISGRGRIRPFGIWLPARFVMVHNAGRDYRHYFEATFFGLPFLRVNEGYIDGQSFFESPMGTYYNDSNTNEGANLALWAEGGWFPAIWLTDPRVRWETVDENTALLRVPFENQTETFIVRFNPETGLVDLMEVMRFKTKNDTAKTLWITSESNGGSTSYATWLDDGKPWAELSLEKIIFNADVSEYIRARGQ